LLPTTHQSRQIKAFPTNSFLQCKGRDQGTQIKEGIVSNHSPIKTDQGRRFQQIPPCSAKAEIKEGISRKTMKQGISNRFLQFKGRKTIQVQ
jgi:hypothetical protein